MNHSIAQLGENGDANSFSCLVCGKTYTRKHACVNHIVKEHPHDTVMDNIPSNPMDLLEKIISPNNSSTLFEDLGDGNLQEQKALFDSIFQETSSH